jgi:hypothetical protein
MASVQVQQPILAFNCVKVGSVFVEECQCVRNCHQTLRRSLSLTGLQKMNNYILRQIGSARVLCYAVIVLMTSGHIWWWCKHKVLKRWWQCFCITNQCLRSNYKQRRWREWHWWFKVHRIRHVFCLNCMELINRHFIRGSSLIWINTFSLDRHLLSGGVFLRLGSSCTQKMQYYFVHCVFTVVWSERCEEGGLAEGEEILSKGRREGIVIYGSHFFWDFSYFGNAILYYYRRLLELTKIKLISCPLFLLLIHLWLFCLQILFSMCNLISWCHIVM